MANSNKELLLNCVRGHRHRDYARTVQIAEWCFSMMTGEDQSEALIQYHTKETQEQKVQRVKITSSKTQFATGNVAKYFNEVHRSDTVLDQLSYSDDADNKKRDRLRDGLKEMAEGGALKEWLDSEYHYRQFYDPNSFLITEWTLDEKKVPKPYALNVDSKDVLDFQFQGGKLAYVAIRQPKWYKKPGSPSNQTPPVVPGFTVAQQKNKSAQPTDEVDGWEQSWKYTIYGKGETVELIQVPKHGEFNPKDYPGFTPVTYHIQNQDVQFLERELTQNIDFCPAQRWGYFADPLTKKRTVVSPLWPVEKVLTDLIRNKSEYDLTKTLHGFYQKFIYVSKCAKCQGTGEIHTKTPSGPGVISCKTCKGSGKMTQQTVQDVIAITLPNRPEEMFDLSKLVHFAEIPQYIAEMQKADVNDAIKEVFSGIFSDRLYDANQVQVTAQEARLNLRSMYNALHPYADNEVKIYKTQVEMISGILEIPGQLINNFSITKDYAMETLDDLFDQRTKAVASGSPQIIIDQIDAKILKKQHQNDPEFINTYEAIQQLKPLRDKTANEVIVITSQLDPNSTLKTQWIYFNDIIEAMKAENPNVFKMPYDLRKLAFDAMTRQFQVENQVAPPSFVA